MWRKAPHTMVDHTPTSLVTEAREHDEQRAANEKKKERKEKKEKKEKKDKTAAVVEEETEPAEKPVSETTPY